MKGKMSLERKLNKIFKVFGVSVSMDDEFAYKDGYVFFTPFETPAEEYHREWILKKFDFSLTEDDYFLFAILHEIGHHYTLYDLSQEELDNEAIYRQILGLSDKSAEELNLLYFNLPAELLATKWAIDFINENMEWCKKTQKKIYEAMRHFVKANRWDDQSHLTGPGANFVKKITFKKALDIFIFICYNLYRK